MNRKLYNLLLLLQLSVVGSGYAAPARSGVATVSQSDGTTIEIQRWGDEFFHYTTTSDGYLIREQDGLYYYAEVSNGGIAVTQSVATRSSTLDNRTKASGNLQLESLAATISQQRRQELAQGLAQGSALTRASASPTPTRALGEVKGLVILVEFADKEFTYDTGDFYRMLNDENYSENEGTGSARDFYIDNSMGQFSPSFDVAGVYTLSQSMAYYGANDSDGIDLRPRDMVKEACELADADGVDFSQYDSDDDGYVDMVFVFYAGYNEAEGASEDTIWPHMWCLSIPQTYDGRSVYIYACTSELKGTGIASTPRETVSADMVGIGTFTHEYGHTLGLMDTYDTNGTTGGYSSGLYSFDIMTVGNYNNDGRTPPYYSAYQRYELGWMTPTPLVEARDYELENISTNSAYIVNTEVEDEYYLLEYRNTTEQGMRCWDGYVSWDKDATVNYGDMNGLFITHIDRSSVVNVSGYDASTLWEYNMPNCYLAHECARVVYSDASVTVVEEAEDLLNSLFPGEIGKTTFGSATSPAARSWAGQSLAIELSNIRVEDERVKFTNYAEVDDDLFDTDGDEEYGDGYPSVEIVKVDDGGGALIYYRLRNSDGCEDIACTLNGESYSESGTFVLSSGSYTLIYNFTKDGQRCRVVKYIDV